jgi:hypothetical protein
VFDPLQVLRRSQFNLIHFDVRNSFFFQGAVFHLNKPKFEKRFSGLPTEEGPLDANKEETFKEIVVSVLQEWRPGICHLMA